LLFLFAFLLANPAQSQGGHPPPPKFEEYPVAESWTQSPAPLKLSTPSERMFKTQLSNAAKEPPNFAGHYRIVFWGCGSMCGAGALIDLQTGAVFQPPSAKPNAKGWDRWIMSGALADGSRVEFHPDSRLVVVRAGLKFSERLQKNVPDEDYFVWDGASFQRVLHVSGRQAGQ
jgi:hypothetical protein